MTSTQQPFPKNKVVLIGKIDQQRQSASERRKGAPAQPAIRTFRNASRGNDYAVGLQVAAPYGGSYQLDVEVGMVDGAELLSSAQVGQLVVLEGYLTRTREVDRRFRDFEEEMIEGIFYQDVALQVERVRPHQESDPQGTGSNIWVEGTVIEPPVFFRHPEFPAIELARVGIRARTRAEVSDTGLIRPGRPCEVTVIVPTDDEGAGYLYRRGNQLRVRGVLERVAMRQNRDHVREKVAELEAAWNERREQIRAMAEGAERTLLVEGSRFLRERERTERAARTMVLAVEVTPMEGGTPISRAEAAEDREHYIQELRDERRRRREEQRVRRRSNLAHEAAAHAADGEGAEAAPTRVPARRPRRQTSETPAEALLVTDAAELSPAPAAEEPALVKPEDVLAFIEG